MAKVLWAFFGCILAFGTVGGGVVYVHQTYYNREAELEATNKVLEDKLGEIAKEKDALTEKVDGLNVKLGDAKEKISVQGKQLKEKDAVIEKQTVLITYHSTELARAEIEILSADISDPEVPRYEVNFRPYVFDTVKREWAPSPTGSRYEIVGKDLHVGGLVIIKDSSGLESAQDLSDRAAIFIFDFIRGSDQKNIKLIEQNVLPRRYQHRVDKMSTEEQALWDDFWQIYHDSGLAEQLGIKSVLGKAVYTRPMHVGEVHQVTLGTDGKMGIKLISRGNIVQ